MKLTKLYIHNYKSFYHTNIELGKFNIVGGENNSGKSNLVDVLEFIDIGGSKGFEKAILDKGGFEKILNYNYDEKKIVIELELEYYTILIKFRISINQELIVVTNIIYAKLNDDIICLGVNATRKNLKVKNIIRREYHYNNIIEKYDLRNEFFFLKVNLNSIISFFSKTYAFNTQNIRDNSHKKSTNKLEKDGSNLGKNLFEIKKNYPKSFDIISNSMIGVVNEIDGIDVQETFGNYLIGFKEKSKDIGIDMVSDGTINLLATITALNQGKDESTMLVFDEPERYLHIKAINYLMSSFRASEKQILITTHSTEILKYADLEEIIFIYRDEDGDTQSIRADAIPDLKGKMDRLGYDRPLTLDELIGDGTIGDFE